MFSSPATYKIIHIKMALDQHYKFYLGAPIGRNFPFRFFAAKESRILYNKERFFRENEEKS